MIKVKHIKKLVAISGFSLGMFLLFGHGCGNFEVKDRVFQSANESVGDMVIIPNTKTVSTSYNKQFLNNLVSCSGLDQIKDLTSLEYLSRRDTLSEYGFATKITGPKIMSMAAIAGEVCADLIEFDKDYDVNSQYFNTIDFSQPPTDISKSALTEVINKLSRSCWQREPTAEEIDMIYAMAVTESDSIANQGDGAMKDGINLNTYDAIISTCTAMLGSLSSIEL